MDFKILFIHNHEEFRMNFKSIFSFGRNAPQMNLSSFIPWRFIIWGIPVITMYIVASLLDAQIIGIDLGLVWLGYCIFKGTVILQPFEFAVVERLGRFRDVYFSGWNIRVIGVDQIRAPKSVKGRPYQIYGDEAGITEIDFQDGSCPVTARIWYQIGNPKYIGVKDILFAEKERLIEDILKWTYKYEDSEERVYSLADAAIRPLLQAKTIDEASISTDDVVESVIPKIAAEMSEIGAYAPTGKRMVVIEDIDLPPKIKEVRELALEGKKKALEAQNRAVGYWQAINEIKEKLNISVEEAKEIFENQRGLEVIQETKPSMNLFGTGLKDILGSLRLGGKHE